MGVFTIFVIAIFMVLGSWASQAMCRTLHDEASIMDMYEQWINQHGRTFADAAEKEKRSQTFKKNVFFVDNFNSEGNRTYKLGLNKFSDLTFEEFLQYHTGFKMPNHYSNSSGSKPFRYENVTADIPTSLDWREKGAVNPIKDQGQCGM